MNARQMKKTLKKRINHLESDNDLMRRIIADSPTMQELYDQFNKPANICHTTMEFQEYKAKRSVPSYLIGAGSSVEYTKYALARDLLKSIKDNISYEIDSEYGMQMITASIFVGRK